ncbi:hypothetical protein T484DRAFT_1757313 [Baffinella frigidus]|nr:hypothetical protein T484DRAFT_1757313 [Cryptophyta sp. CCMP2293]
MSPPSVHRIHRRGLMILGMAEDAARVKGKDRQARRQKVRQAGYRRVRYQQFQGRREDAMEEETREAYRTRLRKSIQVMASWLEAQERTNAEEEKPRFVVVEEEDGPEESGLRVNSPAVSSVVMGVIVEGPANPWEPLMEATVVGEGQALITSFFARRSVV